MEGSMSELPKRTFEGGIWGIVIIISAFMIQFLVFGTTASIGVYNIELLDYFDDATVGVSLIAALNFGIFLGAGPCVSLLMSRFSHRKIALFGSFLVVIGLLGMPLLPYIPVMCISFGVLTGFGSCCVYIPSHVLSGMYYEKYRSLATGLATSGSGLGGAVMPVIVGSLINIFSWKGSFFMLAGLCLHLFVFSALLREPPPSEYKEEVCPSDKEDEGQTSKPIDAECQQCPLLTDPVCEDENYSNRGSEDCKEKVEAHDFMNVDMTQLDFIDKLSWRPGAGFVSTEDILRLEEEKNVRVPSQCYDKNSQHSSSDNENTCSVKEIEDNVSLKDQTSANNCNGQNSSAVVHSQNVNEQIEENGKTSPSSPSSSSSSSSQKEETDGPKIYKHFYIFTNYGFNIYFINNMLWNTAIAILQSFAPEFLRLQGLTPMNAAWMIGGFGFGCFVGGILGGIGGNIKSLDRITVFILANLGMGVSIIFVPIFQSVVSYAVFLTLSGIALGVILGLLIVVLTDLVGIDSLGNGLGYLMLSNGIGTFSGPPLAGLLFYITDGFEAGLYLSGILCIVAGAVMLLIPFRACFDRQKIINDV